MGLNLDFLKSEQSRLNQDGDWKNKYVVMPIKEGSVQVRLLPPGDPDGRKLFQAARYHKIAGKNYFSHLEYVNGKWVGNCPIYAEYRKVWSEIEKLERNGKMDAAKELRAVAGQIRPIEKYYYNCIVRSEVGPDGRTTENVGPKILSVGKELHSKIINSMLGQPALKIKGLGDVTDMNTGRDLQIVKKLRKSGTAEFPEYSQSMFLETSEAGTKDQWDVWTSKLWDLSSEKRLRPINELQDALDVFFGRKSESEISVYTDKAKEQPAKTTNPTISVASVIDDLETSGADDDFINELKNL